MPKPNLKLPDPATLENPLIKNARENSASAFYQRLTKWIAEFDQELDEAHEVGVRLVSFGQTVSFHLEDIGYWNPSLISFKGTSVEGEPVELIQHVNQISILLMKLPRKDPESPKKPFGFQMPEGAEKHEEE
ncbi:MAG: hypothetical protein HUJ26_18750 [Planctomycetaceae bacterium]|nr:hypothetical protein [Planctomycetaceae bacterium]